MPQAWREVLRRPYDPLGRPTPVHVQRPTGKRRVPRPVSARSRLRRYRATPCRFTPRPPPCNRRSLQPQRPRIPSAIAPLCHKACSVWALPLPLAQSTSPQVTSPFGASQRQKRSKGDCSAGLGGEAPRSGSSPRAAPLAQRIPPPYAGTLRYRWSGGSAWMHSNWRQEPQASRPKSSRPLGMTAGVSWQSTSRRRTFLDSCPMQKRRTVPLRGICSFDHIARKAGASLSVCRLSSFCPPA